MKPWGIAFTIFSIFASGSWAADKQPMGFQLLNSKTCQGLAKRARASTFRLVLPTWDKASLRELSGRDDEKFRHAAIAELTRRTLPAPSADDVNIWQMKTCVESKTSDCFISKTYSSASMVLVDDGKEAVTAFHNIKTLLNPYIASGLKQGLSFEKIAESLNNSFLPAFIYDHRGKLVGSPENLSVRISGITADQVRLASQNLDSKEVHSVIDGVSLKLSRKLGQGAPRAKSSPRPGESIFVFGYPTATTDRHLAGGGDSDGHSLYCTKGKAIGIEEAAARMSWDLKTVSDVERQLYHQNTVFLSNDAAGGNSGGPTFNARGELVGVVSRGNNSATAPTTASRLMLSAN